MGSERAKQLAASRNKRWHAENRDSILERKARWYAENKDAVLAKQSAFHKANPDRGRLTASLRRARKRRAVPPWAELQEIRRFYAECPAGFHVDHIIPLVGMTPEGRHVCGLHCISNLRYLPASVNMSRQNRMSLDDLFLVEGVSASTTQ